MQLNGSGVPTTSCVAVVDVLAWIGEMKASIRVIEVSSACMTSDFESLCLRRCCCVMFASGDFLMFWERAKLRTSPPLTPAHHTSDLTSNYFIALRFAVHSLSSIGCISPSLSCIASVAVPSLVMAELPGNGKQPAKHHKPSRLRHEVRPDSTDDEREAKKAKKPVVQEPDSDTVVPETQLDHDGHYNDSNRGLDVQSDYGYDIPMSPNSLAMLERVAVAKKPEAPESTPFTVKLLSKMDFAPNDSSASSVTPFFSFGQARKSPSKTPPKEEVAASQSTAHASLTSPPLEQRDEQVPNGKISSILRAPLLTHPQIVVPLRRLNRTHNLQLCHMHSKIGWVQQAPRTPMSYPFLLLYPTPAIAKQKSTILGKIPSISS
jgi:hypothetical protein